MNFIETCSGVYINTEMITNIRYHWDELHVETLEEGEYQLTNERCLDENLIPYIITIIARVNHNVMSYEELMKEARYYHELSNTESEQGND